MPAASADLDVEPDFDPVVDRRQRLTTLIDAACWCVLVPLVLAALLRGVAGESTVETVALRAFTVWLYLPAWCVLALSLGRRRWPLVAAAFGLVMLHLVWVTPSLRTAEALPQDVSKVRPVRVVSANLLGVNADTADIARELREASADIVLVQEVTDTWAKALSSREMLELYPERSLVVREDSFGIGVMARHPIAVEVVDFGVPAMLITLQVGDAKLSVLHAHTLPPRLIEMVGEWHRMMDRIENEVRRLPRPLLVAGDLNATQFSERYERLQALGLRGAHEAVGRGLATTWPNGRFPLPPIRLDHLLVSDDVSVLDVREGIGRGSDHRPLLAELGLEVLDSSAGRTTSTAPNLRPSEPSRESRR